MREKTMQLHELVNTIGQDLQRRYGESPQSSRYMVDLVARIEMARLAEGDVLSVMLHHLPTKKLRQRVFMNS